MGLNQGMPTSEKRHMSTRIVLGGFLVLGTITMPGCVVFEIRDELKKANENLATANTQLMVANTELDIANAKLLEANSRLAEANQGLTVVNGHLATTILKLEGTNGQIATLQSKHLTNLDTRLDPLGKSLSDVEVHLGSLRKTLDNIDSMIPFINLADPGPDDPADPATAATPQDTAPAAGSSDPAHQPTHSAPVTNPSPTTSPSIPGSVTPPGKPAPTKRAETSARMLPETLQIDGRDFTLSTYLWRNFQPTIGEAPGGKGLLAKLNLIAADKGAAPQGVEAVAVRLQRGKSVWTGHATKESGDTVQTWERMLRPGPAWEIGPGVNVFLQLALPDGSKKWIAAYNQTIERVD
jgi:hypothetical protein